MQGRFTAIFVSSWVFAACAGGSPRSAGAPMAASGAGTLAADSGVADASVPTAPQDAAQSGGDMNVAADSGKAGVGSPAAGTHANAGGSAHAAAGRAAAAGAAGGKGGAAGQIAEDPTIRVTEIATTELAAPSDLAFNPYVNDELWVVNHTDSSATIIANASSPTRSQRRRMDPEGATHFMPLPMGLAFGGRETTIVDAQGKPVEGTFATCPENPMTYMGPTLWASDMRIFGLAKKDREPPFNSSETGGEGPGSHIDMLHRTPACIGIDWEGAGNIYWTYSGTLSMFVRYDFAKDHGIGNADHSDGSEWRYPVKGIGYVAHIPSQLAYDREGKRLYMADTGNGRVVSFDPASATMSKEMSDGDNVDQLQNALDMSGGSLSDLVPGTFGLKKPSGLTLHERRLYVSDNETSTIHKFDLTGAPLGAAVIPGLKAGSLAGLSFGPDGKLYFVDMLGSRVLRLENTF